MVVFLVLIGLSHDFIHVSGSSLIEGCTAVDLSDHGICLLGSGFHSGSGLLLGGLDGVAFLVGLFLIGGGDGAVTVLVGIQGICVFGIVGFQLVLAVGEVSGYLLGILVSQDAVSQDLLEEVHGHHFAVQELQIGLLRVAALDAVHGQVVHVLVDGCLACLGQGVAGGLGLAGQDAHALELLQGRVHEVVGVSSAVLLIKHLLAGGQGGVIAHVDAVCLVLLGLIDEVVGHSLIVVGDLCHGVLLLAYGGGGGGFVYLVSGKNAGVPDQQGCNQNGADDADGPIEFCLGTGSFSLIGAH